MMNNEYKAEGFVVGITWSGDIVGFEANKYHNTDLNKLKEDINKDFKSGGLDSGMGYQRLEAALMFITTTSYVEVDGKTYSRDDVERLELGNKDLIDDFTEAYFQSH